MAYSRLRGQSAQFGYTPLPFNGAGNYGSQGRATVGLLPPADVLPLKRREITQREIAEELPQDQADALIERLVGRLQDIGVYDPRKYVTFTSLAFAVDDQGMVILERPTAKRVYLFLENIGAPDTVWIDFDKPAIPNQSVPLYATGGAFEWLAVVPQNIIYARMDVGEGTTVVAVYAEMPLKGQMRDRA